VLGVEHPNTLTSVDNLGLVLYSQGKYEEAEAMHRRALIGYEKVLGPDHPDMLTSVSNLGLVLDSQGKYEEAEEMHRRALAAREKVLGVEHPNTLTSVDNLGLVLYSQGKYEEAEAMHRRALIGYEKALGPVRPYMLTSVSNLGLVLDRQGKYEEAEVMHRQALVGYMKVLGPKHPETLASIGNLVSTYRNQSRWKEAEELEVQAMEMRKRVLRQVHPSMVREFEEKVTQSLQRNTDDNQSPLPEPVPSLTSGPTVESTHRTLNENHTKESPMSHDTGSDIGSVVSDLPPGISQEEKEQIVNGFTCVISEKFRNRQLKFSMSSVPQERAKQVFASKLKRYSKVITNGTPQAVEFTRRRNAAKAVFWHRAEIVDEFVRMTFPAHEQEQETERARTIWTNETVQESSEEKVNAWRIDLSGNYESNPYHADADVNMANQKSDDTMEIYPCMEFEPVEDDRDPVMARDYKTIREYLTTHEEFDILDSELEKVAKHYYGDIMKLIQMSILGTLGASTNCFKANFQAKWNIREFIEEQYGSDLQDIRQILTITGNCHDAQMTTVDGYLKQTWPACPSALLDKLQLSILGSNPNERKEWGMVLLSTLSLREIDGCA
jgi:tetratricopeptide (TPR) repeat protein